MNNKLLMADLIDVLSVALLQNVSVGEVLNWVYTALLIASLSLGIILKIAAALSDRKVTKDEAEGIKEAVDEAKSEIKEEAERQAKNDKEEHR